MPTTCVFFRVLVVYFCTLPFTPTNLFVCPLRYDPTGDQECRVVGTKRRLRGNNLRVRLESVWSRVNGPTRVGMAERLAVRPSVFMIYTKLGTPKTKPWSWPSRWQILATVADRQIYISSGP